MCGVRGVRKLSNIYSICITRVLQRLQIYPFAFDFLCALLYFFFFFFYYGPHTEREITQRYGRNTRLNYGDSAFDGFALRVVYITGIVVSK